MKSIVLSRGALNTSVPIALLVVVCLAACANPLNRATSDNYAETCAVAERNGKLAVAEEACYRALINVDWGNLGPALKSQRLYNLGRIKRRLAKFAEAESLFRESLLIEEKLSDPSDVKIGRRLVELSVSLAGQDKWAEGAPILDRVLPMADNFEGRERAYTVETLEQFSKHLKGVGEAGTAKRFDTEAMALQAIVIVVTERGYEINGVVFESSDALMAELVKQKVKYAKVRPNSQSTYKPGYKQVEDAGRAIQGSGAIWITGLVGNERE